MLHAEAEIQAVKAAQSIANADSGFDNSQTCVKTKERPPRLKTVSSFDMKVKGAWRARRDLYRSLCLTPKGRISIRAAEVYADILDLFIGSPDRVQEFCWRDCCYYWGRPIAKWAKRYGCTEDQFDGWLKILRDCGLIATCVMKTHGTNKLHIRPLVAVGSACLSGWPDERNYAHLLKAQTQAQQGPAGSFGPHLESGNSALTIGGGNLALTKDLGCPTSYPKNKADPVQASPDTTPIQDQLQCDQAKDKPESKATANPDAVKEVPKFSAVVERYLTGMKELWPSHCLPLKDRGPKLLKDARNKLYAEGIDWHDFLTLIQTPKHWGRACKYATPCPQPEYLSAHLPEFVAYYRQNNPQALAADALAEAEAMAEYQAKVLAEKAAECAPAEPVDTHLSVVDAWTLVERASALIPGLQYWRENSAKLAEFKQKHPPELLEIALLLIEPAEPQEQPATPSADLDVTKDATEVIEPVTQAAVCPPAGLADEPDIDDEPLLSEAEKIAALAQWLPKATEAAKAAAAAAATKKASTHYTAAVKMPGKQQPKATMFQPKVAA